MNSIAKSAMAAACMFLSAAIASSDRLPIDASAPKRYFVFTYVAKLSSLPGDAKLSRVWIPLPQTDGYQTIFASVLAGGSRLQNRSCSGEDAGRALIGDFLFGLEPMLNICAAKVRSIKAKRFAANQCH